MRIRSKSREIALCILYELDVINRDTKELIDSFYSNYTHKEETRQFASLLVDGVAKNIVELDSIIKKYVKNWGISRMAVIDRSVLRIGTYELIFVADIPPKVSINEAVELAKKFGDIDSPRFVNGILDKIYKSEGKKKID